MLALLIQQQVDCGVMLYHPQLAFTGEAPGPKHALLSEGKGVVVTADDVLDTVVHFKLLLRVRSVLDHVDLHRIR